MPLNVAGFKLHDPAHIVFEPSFGPTYKEFAAKFSNPADVVVSQRSTLLLLGRDIVVDSLDVDGTLVIEAVPGEQSE